MNNKRVLITGVTGFVGPYMAKKLLDSNYEVYGLIRRRAEGSRPKRLVETDLLGDVKILDGDVTNLTSLLFALESSQPDIIYHFAAQSFIPRSFEDPLETFRINCLGTQNLLEAVRVKDVNAKLIFPGSSEEYGLIIASQKHYRKMLEKYKVITPEPQHIPELPVDEDSPLRPMSPYAVSKLYGDYLMRNYFHSYGLKTIISRAFNHEGAGRGHEFVTSTIVRQAVMLKNGETDKISVGNINAFRDWSHVEDIIEGYYLLSQKANPGEVYVQGSMRTNSVLTYILLTLEQLGYKPQTIETLRGAKKIKNPTERDNSKHFGINFEKTKVDKLMLNGELDYNLKDKGTLVKTNKGKVVVEFAPTKFRPAEVPILMSNTTKAQKLGFKITKTLTDIIKSQINYYLNPENRKQITVQ